MRKVIRNVSWFLVDGLDLGGDTNTVKVGLTAQAKESTCLKDTAIRRDPGLLDGSASFGGFSSEIGQLQHVAAVGACSIPWKSGTVVEGDSVITLRGVRTSVEEDGQVGEHQSWKLELQGSGLPPLRGQLLSDSRAGLSVSGNGPDLALGALTDTQALTVVVHVLDVTGSPTLALESDEAPFSTPVTRASVVVSATGHVLLTVVGPVTDTRWRLVWTLGGGEAIELLATAAIYEL